MPEIVLPYQIDFTVYRTVDFRFVYVMQDENGTPVNNTGYQIGMQVREEPGAPVLIDRNTTNGGITLGGASGQVTIHVPYTMLTPIAEGSYEHDVIEQAPGGDRVMLFRGGWMIRLGITQSIT